MTAAAPLSPPSPRRLYSAFPADVGMKLHLDQITEEPKHLSYDEGVADLNARLETGAHEYRFADPVHAELDYYRAGDDVVFEGDVQATASCTCARCAEEFRLPLDVPIRAVLAPRPPVADEEEVELSAEDLGLGFFDGDEIDVSDLVTEHTLLALPTRPLCSEGCRGLCARCGANLNAGPCRCAGDGVDSPFAVLRTRPRGS
jgi:uncharacterized protein